MPAAAAAPVVTVRGVNHSFGGADHRKRVLHEINLDLLPGEIAIMTGPSGSGKTTLLTLIGALRAVQEGSIRAYGRELRTLSRRELVDARRQIGFIFQGHNLFDSLSARQNDDVACGSYGVRGCGHAPTCRRRPTSSRHAQCSTTMPSTTRQMCM